MRFTLQKNVTTRKQRPFKGLINLAILFIALPVVVIAAVSVSLYFLFFWLRNRIIKPANVEDGEENYRLELELICNDFIQITLIEDETDVELTALLDAWQEIVYTEDTYLYRVKSIPVVPALENAICCFYYKEYPEGLLLQVLPGNQSIQATLKSQLIFLNYKNYVIDLVDETGSFFLFNDKNNHHLIRGFNKTENISIEVIPSNQSII